MKTRNIRVSSAEVALAVLRSAPAGATIKFPGGLISLGTTPIKGLRAHG